MPQYINKSTLVAEIERRIKEIEEIGTYLSPKGVLTNLLCHLDTLEVKEVDLEKIINDYFKDWKFDEELDIMVKPNNYSATFDDIKELAKHFFELGMAQHQNIWHPMSEIINHPCTILMHGYGNDVWICDAVDKLQPSTAQEWAYIDDVLLLLGLKAQKGE